MPASRSDATVAPSARFESFFPSSPRISPWWTNSGGVAPSASNSRRWSASFGRWSFPRGGGRPVVVSADDVRDPEVHVVHDARQVVGGRAVLADEGRAVEALAELGGGLEMAFATVALPHRTPPPLESEPLEVAKELLLPARDVARRVGIVDPEQQPVAERPVGGGAERVSDVQRPRRARGEADPFHGSTLVSRSIV